MPDSKSSNLLCCVFRFTGGFPRGLVSGLSAGFCGLIAFLDILFLISFGHGIALAGGFGFGFDSIIIFFVLTDFKGTFSHLVRRGTGLFGSMNRLQSGVILFIF